MKFTLIAVGGLVLLAGAATLFFTSQTEASFMESYNKETNAIMIDIRTPEEFATGHIQGAINIDFYDPQFVTLIQTAAGGKDVYLYCRSGSRSAQAETLLTQQGMQVTTMEGGLMAYKGELVK